MSKKKAKKAPKSAKKAARKKPARAAAGKSAARPISKAVPPPSRRTAAATIFLYKVDGQTRVRTSPQLLSAGPGNIEWTVVNLSSDEPVEVDIVWQKESPWGGTQPIRIQNGNYRRSLDDAKNGHYKYNVMCDGFCEDPEVEIPGT
jgi:hypothetical protein